MNHQQKKKYREGADIARLDFHNWLGTVMDRTRGSTTQKDIGFLMINKIQDRFNISKEDLELFRKQMREKELEDFKEMERLATLRGKYEKDKAIERDESGNIVSPSSSKYPKPFNNQEWGKRI